LSGNAITEALVFGRKAGKNAAARALSRTLPVAEASAFGGAVDFLMCGIPGAGPNPAAMIEELQALMQKDVGPFRTGPGLERALARIRTMREGLGEAKPPGGTAYDTALVDWLDLRTMLAVAEGVTHSALQRTESRGAHQREDYPGMDPAWQKNQVIG
jgi:succinate dehydrogenase/fumarate reductase flavoprotein subunit